MQAYATFDDDELVIGNGLVERRWRLRDGQLLATSLLNKATGRQWALTAAATGPLAVGNVLDAPPFVVRRMRTAVSAEFLRAELVTDAVTRRFDVFDGIAAITMQMVSSVATAAADLVASNAKPTGIEQDQPSLSATADTADLVDSLSLDTLHCDFAAVEMGEQTDVHDNLVFERRWMLHPSERRATASGNVFFVEHRQSGEGFVILKHAPAPYARPQRTTYDCRVMGGTLEVRGHGLGAGGGEGYPHTAIAYAGGSVGRTAALQRFQMHLRVPNPKRDGLLLSNTWGNRNRDAAISESFLLAEAKAGAELGVDVMQIDDGWQKGRSGNSAEKGGVWNGFWASDEQFWKSNASRLPNGFQPIVDELSKHGMNLGLWYAPDSSDDCRNWKRDAEQVLSLWREHGVRHVKIDAVKMHSKLAEANVARFYEHVLAESDGAICFDADVTAEVRPGFWGLMHVGPVFVENRYTDWHSYWPHHTLRNLWRLSHYIPPSRLRMEFLDASRNVEKYAGDLLAPSRYAPDTLFATVMFSSPLAWLEVLRLPAAHREQIARLVAIWKTMRDALIKSPIIPIGREPDGFSWTGFQTLSGTDRDFALVFNELSDVEGFDVPDLGRPIRQVKVLHGDATVSGTRVRIGRPLGHALLEIAR